MSLVASEGLLVSLFRIQRPPSHCHPNDSISPEIASPPRGVHGPDPKPIDAAPRLVSGVPARPEDATHTRVIWPEIEATVQHA